MISTTNEIGTNAKGAPPVSFALVREVPDEHLSAALLALARRAGEQTMQHLRTAAAR